MQEGGLASPFPELSPEALEGLPASSVLHEFIRELFISNAGAHLPICAPVFLVAGRDRPDVVLAIARIEPETGPDGCHIDEHVAAGRAIEEGAARAVAAGDVNKADVG